MAFRTKKISQMDPKGSNLASTDLLEISELVSGSYVTKSITGAEIIASVPPTSVEWGDIGGTLSSQTDLNTALSGKQATISLTTTGTGAATFVSNVLNVPTPAAATFSSLTTTGSSGASTLTAGVLNVPTYSLSGLGGVPTTRTISTTSPLSGGGDLSANRTLSIATANTTTTGALSSTDWNTFNGKQATLVSGTNIKTINGTTLLGSGDLVVGGSSAIAIGTTAITSGTVGRVLFEGTGNVVQESANLFWDNTNGRLGVGTASPSNKLDISGNATGGNPTRLGITNTGASGVADLFAFNDTGRFLGLQMFGSTATSTFAGINNANLAKFVTNNTFVVGTSGSNPLVFAMNGSVLTGEVARFSTNSNFLINTTTDAGFKLDVNGTARVSGNTVVTSWIGVGGVTTPSGSGEKFNVQGAQVISGASGAGNFLLYQISGASRFIVGSEASIGGTANNYINYVYGNNSHITYTNNVARLTVTGGGNVLINTTTDIASSKLTIESTTQGVLFPRMTTTQKNAIASPATGLMVYDTTLNVITYYNGTTWI